MSSVIAPVTPNEVLAWRSVRPEAILVAGGTEVLSRGSSRTQESPLIFLNGVHAWRGARLSSDWLVIGACTTFAEMGSDPLIAERAPLLVEAAERFAPPAIRKLGTLGGNICSALSMGDALPPLYLMGAEVELVSQKASRRVPIADFITDQGQTLLGPDEVLSQVWVPPARSVTQQCYEKIGQYRASKRSTLVSFAARLRINQKLEVLDIALAWGNVGPRVLRLDSVEQMLLGQPLTMRLIGAAEQSVRKEIAPLEDDQRSVTTCRRVVAANLLHRFLAGAVSLG